MKRSVVLLLIGLMLVSSLVSGLSAQQGVKTYWLARGLDDSTAQRISIGEATQQDISRAEELDKPTIINQTNATTTSYERIDDEVMFWFVGLLVGFMAFIIFLLYLGWKEGLI